MARLHRCYQVNETKLTLLIPTFLSLCLFKRNFVAPTCSHFGKKALSRMVTMGARGMMSFHAITHRQGSETRHMHIRRVTNTIGLNSTTHIHISMVTHCHGSETHIHQQPLPWVWNKTQTLESPTTTGLEMRHRVSEKVVLKEEWFPIKVVFYQRFEYIVTSVRFRLNRTHTHTHTHTQARTHTHTQIKETRRNVT